MQTLEMPSLFLPTAKMCQGAVLPVPATAFFVAASALLYCHSLFLLFCLMLQFITCHLNMLPKANSGGLFQNVPPLLAYTCLPAPTFDAYWFSLRSCTHLGILSCSFTETDPIRTYQSSRNNAATERKRHRRFFENFCPSGEQFFGQFQLIQN